MGAISLATKGILCSSGGTRLVYIEKIDIDVNTEEPIIDIDVKDIFFDLNINDININLLVEDLEG